MSTDKVDKIELQEQDEKYEIFHQRYINKSREIASKYLQELEALPGEPEEFAYFKNIFIIYDKTDVPTAFDNAKMSKM